MKTTPLSNRNPLNNRSLTAEEYHRLSREAQSKASWLLLDHVARLDAEMAAERRALEPLIAEADKELAGLNAERKRMSDRRAKAVASVRKSLTELPEMKTIAAHSHGVAIEVRELREAHKALLREAGRLKEATDKTRREILRARQEDADARLELASVRDETAGTRELVKAARAEATQLRKKQTAARRAVAAIDTVADVLRGAGDGRRRLLDAADEVGQLRSRRKAAAKAGAVNAAVSA